MASKSKLAQYFQLFTLAKEESALQVQGPEAMSKLVEKIEALIVILDERGRIVEFNPASERLSGYNRKEVLGRELDFLVPPAEKGQVRKITRQLLTEETRASYESHWLTKSGQKRTLVWSGSSIRDKRGKIKNVVCFGLDVTEIQVQEDRRLVILNLLEVLASPGDQNYVLEHILEIVRDYLDCAAAGIRLRKGEDYPYIKTLGFTEDFIKSESFLTCLEAGSIKRDDDGTVHLDCICGRVIRGDLTEGQSALTADGAFYTGNINELVAKFSSRKLPFKIRNHCGRMGYKSIALIPLRFHDKTVGLLQLNDYDEDKFSDDEIDFLTVAGQSIGAALVRFQAEQERQKAQLILDTVIRKAREGFSLSTQDGKFLIYNEAMERITGYNLEEMNHHGWFYLVFPNEEERRQAVYKARQAVAGKIDYMELIITHKDGTRKPVALTLTPLEIDGITYNFSTVIDLSTKYENETLF